MLNDILPCRNFLNLRISKFTLMGTTLRFGKDTYDVYQMPGQNSAKVKTPSLLVSFAVNMALACSSPLG